MAVYFPLDLGSNSSNRPYIMFTCKGRGSTVIGLPIPGSLQFSDGATYNNTELGVRGQMIAGAAAAGATQGFNLNTAKNLVGDAVGSLKSTYADSSIASMIQGITSVIPSIGDEYKSAVSIGTGTTVNKYITTEFTSTNTRVFSFVFELIGKSASESNTIKSIVKTFREGLYPEVIGSAGLQLKYPPKWTIKFQQRGGGDLNHLPKIGETYLTEVNTTYNGSSNMWRTDGSPLETSIQVSFMETKAYTYDTITKL